LEMMRLAFEYGRSMVVGTGGTLREGSTSLGALRRALAAYEETSRSAEPVGAVA